MQEIGNTPAMGILAFNLVGVLFNIIFGAVGGFLGWLIYRTDRRIAKITEKVGA